MTRLALDSPARDEAPQRARWLAGPAAPLAAAVAALAVTVAGIGGPAFWLDEAATVSVTGRPTGQMLRVFHHLDLVHALYYLIMRPWVMVFGDGEVALRLPSALATAAAAAGIVLIGRRCAGPLAGLFAGLVYAGSVAASKYAIEARSYAMVTAVAVLATYLLVRGVGPGGRHPWRWLAGYGVAIAFLGLLNLDALLLLPAHGVTLLATRDRAPRTWLRWPVCSGLAGAALIPFVLAAQSQSDQVNWLPRPSSTTVWRFLKFMTGNHWLVAPVLALAVAGAIAGVRARGRDSGTSLTAVAVPWLLLPPAVLIAVSLVADPMFIDRYVLFCLPALSLLTGAGLALLTGVGRPPAGALLAAAVAVAMVAVTVPTQLDVRRQDAKLDDLRTPADVVRREAHRGDAILYLGAVVRWDAAAYPEAFGRLDDIGMAEDPVRAGNILGRDKFPNELRGPLSRAQRLWVMGSRSLGKRPGPLVGRRRLMIRATGPWRIARVWTYKGGKLTLYVRTGPYESPSKPHGPAAKPHRTAPKTRTTSPKTRTATPKPPAGTAKP
ncbi:glycosyltransferase family 39 protein [Actinomadura nitritigenes]|uniref:glycosyltransferase family 39 protein n=1 Tax=Actinomadura nitritigenes TaxID=134602 RepID=UPI003D912049